MCDHFVLLRKWHWLQGRIRPKVSGNDKVFLRVQFKSLRVDVLSESAVAWRVEDDLVLKAEETLVILFVLLKIDLLLLHRFILIY